MSLFVSGFKKDIVLFNPKIKASGANATRSKADGWMYAHRKQMGRCTLRTMIVIGHKELTLPV